MKSTYAPYPKILSTYLYIAGLALLFWWPLSHWFFSEWYHQILGFTSWNDSFVRIIGTCGLAVTALIFLAAKNPLKNSDMILILIGFALALAATYTYNILYSDFPPAEWANVAACLINAGILMILRPRRLKNTAKR